MGLFWKKTKKEKPEKAPSVSQGPIVFPSDQELFPALFQEGGPRSFRSRYSAALRSARYEGLFDFPEDVKKKLTEYEEKGKISKSELNSYRSPYKDRVHQLWISLEEELKTEIEQGTIDSFPEHYYLFETVKWGDELYPLELLYFGELRRAVDEGKPEWPWFSVCRPIWKSNWRERKNKAEVLKVVQQVYRLLRYYTLWNSTLAVPHPQVRNMQDTFCGVLKWFNIINDYGFLYEVPELPEDLMAEAELAVPHHPIKKTPPEQFASLKYGDILRFGSYPYEKDGSQRSIEWEVIDGRLDLGWVYVISTFCLDVKQFHHSLSSDVTWENCDLRRWLNEDFYRTAFTEEERRYIAPEVYRFVYDPGAIEVFWTKDCLCIPDRNAAKCFTDEMRSAAAKPTPYAYFKMEEVKNLYISPYTDTCGWWRRDAPRYSGSANVVDYNGNALTENINKYLPVRVMFKLKFDPDSEL